MLEHPGLVVVEVEGEGSVRSIRELLASRADLQVVAAVPDAMAGAEPALAALGVETTRWDGSPGAVMGVIARRMEGGGDGSPALAELPDLEPAPTAPAAPAAPRPQADGAPGPAFFADLPPVDDDVEVVSFDDLAPEPEPAGAGGSLYVPPPAPPGAPAWPSGGLAFADAESALVRGLEGAFQGDSTLRTVTEGVMGTLTALEFAVVSGDAVPVDPEPVKRAALMRLRVAFALAERPAPGSAVDQAALSTMLGEIDALLSQVNALSQGAAPDVLPSVEALRNALVKEAIDFSEAAQQIAPVEPVLGEALPAAVTRRAPQARLLNVSAEPDRADARGRTLWVVLVLAALGAGGFHGWRWWERSHRVPPPPLIPAGAPGRAIGAASQGNKFLASKDGKPFTDAEIETFRQSEELAGRKVLVLSPTTLVSVSAQTPPPAAAPRAAPAPAAPPPAPQGARP